MSPILDRRTPPRRVREPQDCRPRTDAGAPEAGPTLDDVVSRTWEVLRAGVSVACLICGHELTARPSAGAGVVGGRCEDCGSTLG
jgi:hypothetical protein